MKSHSLQKLLGVLENQDESAQLEAIRELSQGSAEEQKIEILITLLSSPSKAVQEAAVETLIALRGEDVVKKLVYFLSIEEANLRNLAIEVLNKIGSDAPQHLYDILEQDDDDAKIFALDILGVLEYEQAMPSMAKALESNNVNVRNACMMAMARIASEEAIPYFLKGLEDSEEWVCFSAIDGLCQVGDAQALKALVQKLEASRQEPYYQGILACFVEIGKQEVIIPLFNELAYAPEQYHGEIIQALSELIAGKGLPGRLDASLSQAIREPITKLFQSQDPWTAFRALEVVGQLGDHDYFEILLKTLESPNELVQAGVLAALDKLATPEDLARLEAFAASHTLALKDEFETLKTRLQG